MGEIAADIGPWVAIVALVIGITNTISQWISRPGKELADKIEKLASTTEDKIKALAGATTTSFEAIEGLTNERFKEHDRRIQRIEDNGPHQPTKEDLHTLALQMQALSTKLEALDTTVGRMDRHLREKGE